MLNKKEITRLSKFISLVLRHKPGTIGLSLDANGWAETAVLIKKMSQHNVYITAASLDYVVATNSKKRFSFNEDKTLIRANQGHSIDIDLKLSPVQPPAILYHGTGGHSIASILKSGLNKRQRQHVHLSKDIETAFTVGKRHGHPAVLIVDAASMFNDGFQFYLSDNGVWLTDHVLTKYLRLLEESRR